jgi:hypothetical protein
MLKLALSLTLMLFAPAAPAEVIRVGYSEPPDVQVDKENGAADGVGDTVKLSLTDGGTDTVDTTAGGSEKVTSPSHSTSPPKDPLAGLGQVQLEQWCGWTSLPSQPPPGDAEWAGNDPTTGVLKFRSCAVLFPGAPGAPGNPDGRPVQIQFFPNNLAPPAPPPINPAVLAREAIARLTVPNPAIGAGPDRSKLAVNLWTWLWVDNPGQLLATVTAGGVSVPATATLTSVTWTLGEPATQGETYQQGSPATITCQGASTPPPATFDWKAEPPCGHQFHWRSLKERTGGTGTWPITATTNWTVTWQSNTGVTGGTTLNATSNDQFDIGEYRIVLVQGPGG